MSTITENTAPNRVDHETIRHFLWDRTVADNPAELDLVFTDDEIGHAMRFACLSFNAMLPHVMELNSYTDVTDSKLIYPFIVSTCGHLCLAKAQRLAREDMDYSAGNMTVDATRRRIDHLMNQVKLCKEESASLFKDYKLAMNISNGFAQVG